MVDVVHGRRPRLSAVAGSLFRDSLPARLQAFILVVEPVS